MKKYEKKNILNFLTQLLHPKHEVSISNLMSDEFFWEDIVSYGSSHQVLPAIYGSFLRKKVQKYVPEDLLNYLKEISEINFNRNQLILNQIFSLSDTLNQNNINHVFLKGSVMLSLNPHNSFNERMVGDIDILVDEKDINEAKKILIDSGYSEDIKNDISLSENVLDAKHLNRITHKNFIAAVELHRYLLNNLNIDRLRPNNVLNEKIKTDRGVWITSKLHSWEYAILNYQYNDFGIYSNNISLKALLDAIYLESDDIFLKIRSSHKGVIHFYSIISVFYSEYPAFNKPKKWLFEKQLSCELIEKLNWLYFKFKLISNFIFSRFKLFIKSKYYRKMIYKNYNLLIKKFNNYIDRK